MSAVETSYGHVLSVQSRILGSALVGDQAAGTAAVVVQDCSDFNDQNGGTVTLNGATYTYAGPDVDDEASTVTLTPALVADASDGDEIQILDPVLGSPQYESTASVTEDGEGPGDSFEAAIESAVIEQLPEGIRGVAGESVRIAWDEWGQPSVTGIIGVNDNQAGFAHWTQDYATATGNTDTPIRLKYQPVGDSSVKVSWNGIGLDRSEWDFAVGDPWTIIVPAQGFHADDEFEAHYAWTDPTPRPVVPASAVFIGSTVTSNNVTSIDLPAGAAAGHLFTLSMGTGLLDGSAPSSSDSRIADHISDSGGHNYVAYGFLDGSGGPIAVSVSDGENNGKVVLAVYDVAGTVTVEKSSGASGPMAPTMPTGSPDVGIMVNACGGTDGSGISVGEDWTLDVLGHGSGTAQMSWHCDTGCPSFSFTTNQWAAIVLGLTGG